MSFNGEQIYSRTDIIRDIYPGSRSKTWLFELSLYRKKLKKNVVDMLLNGNFIISQAKIIYGDETEETLIFVDKESTDNETVVSYDNNGMFIDIDIALDSDEEEF